MDAECVYSMASQDERVAYSLTVAKAGSLIRDYIRTGPAWDQVIARLDREGPVPRDHPSLTTSYDIKTGDGKTLALNLTVARTHEGVRSPLIVSSLITHAMLWRHTETGSTSGPEKIAVWAKAARADGPILRRAGFQGLLQYDTMTVVGWDDWAETLERRYAMGLQRRQAGG